LVGRWEAANKWAELVQRYQDEHGLSLSQTARLLGVDRRTVMRWKDGSRIPSPRVQRILEDGEEQAA
jgi:transcriptional regulator with XRE-family HTH domain